MPSAAYRCPLLAMCVLVCLGSSTFSLAATNQPDRTSWGHSISVGPNEQVGDLTCFGCSIRLRGKAAGDVTVFFGNVTVEDQGDIAGDVTAFGGDVRLDQGVKVAGDVTVFGGELRRNSEVMVQGDVTNMGGRGWAVPILLAPFVILGLVVAFIVWLIQRSRRPSATAVAA